MKTLLAVLATVAFALAVTSGLVWTGAISFAADEPHSDFVFHTIESARERSIAARASGVEVPNLDDPKLLGIGAEHYAEMCTGCHLAPGMEQTEMRAGLYPQPPVFAQSAQVPAGIGQPVHIHATGDPREVAARQFWIVKHGIKASGMPAWGVTHDDESIWGLVAFLQKLPAMSAEEYRKLTSPGESGHHHHHEADAPASDDSAHAHEHGDDDGFDHALAGHGDHGDEPRAGHGGHHHASSPAPEPDTADGVVDAFTQALASGHADDAQRWLAPDVLIYESGDQETSRQEYAAHHLGADMAFLGKARIERLARDSRGSPYIAWVTTRTRIRSTAGTRPVDVLSTETMVLTHEENQGWRIRHIHWSSRSA